MRVVAVGGVVDDMSAAAHLRRHDESTEVIVLERGSYASFANCGLPYYVGGKIEDSTKPLLHTPQSLRAALSLDVYTNSEVTAINLDAYSVTVASSDTDEIYTLSHDYLILSPGALAACPPIDGLDSPRMHALRTVDNALALYEASGTRAIVLGAGFIDVEAVKILATRGFETCLVELAEHVLPPLEVEVAALVTQELRGLGVHVHVGIATQTIARADNNGVVTLSDGTVLHADVVVLSAGVRPGTAVVEAAGTQTRRGYVIIDGRRRTSAGNIYAIGDGTIGRDHDHPVALADPANRDGRSIVGAITDAERNEATARPIPSPQGTAIVRIGGLIAAMTGADRQALDALGTEYFTVRTCVSRHAGYFPGAQPVHILMYVSAGGEILGAQAVDTDGMGRHIDVTAAAIHARLEAADLIDLDLAYAPPYGQAKDPISQTGVVAHNVTTGELILIGPDTFTEDVPVLDVRTPGGYATGHVPSSLNIPHTQLHDRLDKVRAWVDENAHRQPFVVMCTTSVRSWVGYRVVRAADFDVAMLPGDIQTLRVQSGGRAVTTPVKEQGRDMTTQAQIVNRLKRARGQSDIPIGQLESGGGNCREVLTRFAVVNPATKRASYLAVATIISQYAQEIVGSRGEIDPESARTKSFVTADRVAMDELEQLLLRLTQSVDRSTAANRVTTNTQRLPRKSKTRVSRR